jgi:hypothetical protein
LVPEGYLLTLPPPEVTVVVPLTGVPWNGSFHPIRLAKASSAPAPSGTSLFVPRLAIPVETLL